MSVSSTLGQKISGEHTVTTKYRQITTVDVALCQACLSDAYRRRIRNGVYFVVATVGAVALLPRVETQEGLWGLVGGWGVISMITLWRVFRLVDDYFEAPALQKAEAHPVADRAFTVSDWEKMVSSG